jgi:hypothetical protein
MDGNIMFGVPRPVDKVRNMEVYMPIRRHRGVNWDQQETCSHPCTADIVLKAELTDLVSLQGLDFGVGFFF